MTDLTLLGAEKNWISKVTRDIFFQALLRILSSLWIFQVGLLCSLILTPKNGPKIFDWFESRAISRPHTIPLEVWNLFLDQSLSPESSVSPSSNPHKKKLRHVRDHILLKNGAISCSILHSFEKKFFQYLSTVFSWSTDCPWSTNWRSVRPEMSVRPQTIALELNLGTGVFSLFDLSVAHWRNFCC